MNRLYLRFFGRFSADLNEQQLKITAPKQQALLAWLALQPDAAHSRETIAALLWPEHDGTRAQQNLRKTLSRLRKVLSDHLMTTRSTVQLSAESEWQSDLGLFNIAIKREQWEAASAAYAGDFLLGVEVDSAEFEAWALLKREYLRRDYLRALGRLTEVAFATSDYASAYQHAWRRSELDPFDEATHRHIMLSLSYQDRQRDALAQYEKLVLLLDNELAVDPAAETTELYTSIRDGTLSAVAPTVKAPLKHNLPGSPTVFIGRHDELKQIVTQLAKRSCRLLTLIGMGGVGKTHTSLAVADRLLGSYRDGVWFVPLAAVQATNAAIVTAVADTLGIQFSARTRNDDSRRQHVVDWLSERHLLLVLDNYEHLLEHYLLISDLLTAAPDVDLLLTSREPLNLQAEWRFELSGLDMPTGELLFVTAAQRFLPDFAASPAVAKIVELAGGIPLALELAAAWSRTFSAEQIAEQIGTSIDFLSSRLRDIPQRHRSMRAVFEQTWQLLSTQEQAVFAKLSVFLDPFTADGAKAVAEAAATDLDDFVGRSMLRHDGEHYSLHPLLRQFSAEKLTPSASRATTQQHAAHYLSTLAIQDDIPSIDSIRRISTYLRDIESAWNVALTSQQHALLRSALDNLHRYYEAFGSILAGHKLFTHSSMLLERSLNSDGLRDPAAALLYADLLLSQAAFCYPLSRFDELLGLAQKVHVFATDNDNRAAAARASIWIGTATNVQGDGPAAHSYFEQGLALAETSDDLGAEADALIGLSGIENQLGNLEKAFALARRAMQISLDLEDPNRLIRASAAMATCHAYRDDFAGSLHWWKEALDVATRAGNVFRQATMANNLGVTHVHMGNLSEGIRYFSEALPKMRAVGENHGVSLLLGNLGFTNTQLNRFDAACDYLTQAIVQYDRIGQPDGRADSARRMGLLHLRIGKLAAAKKHLTNANEQYETLHNERGLAIATSYLATAYLWDGAMDEALRLAGQAVEFGRKSDQERALAIAQNAQGRIHLAREEFTSALHVLQEAYAQQELQERHVLVFETLSGMAAAQFGLGEVAKALSAVDAILEFYQERPLHGAIDPIAVYLHCHKILDAAGDGRAQQVAEDGMKLLDQISADIASPRDRQQYRNNIPSHRQLLALGSG